MRNTATLLEWPLWEGECTQQISQLFISLNYKLMKFIGPDEHAYLTLEACVFIEHTTWKSWHFYMEMNYKSCHIIERSCSCTCDTLTYRDDECVFSGRSWTVYMLTFINARSLNFRFHKSCWPVSVLPGGRETHPAQADSMNQLNEAAMEIQTSCLIFPERLAWCVL